MIELDLKRHEEALATIDRIASPSVVLRAMMRVAAIERRMLRRLWNSGQRDAQGSTLHLSPGDAETVRRHLLAAGVDIDDARHLPHTIDNLRWAAFQNLRDRLDDAAFQRRIRTLLKSEATWLAGKASCTSTNV